MVGVRASAISRIGTSRSGREPWRWILLEPGIGRTTSADRRSASCNSCEGTAFIEIRPVALRRAVTSSAKVVARGGALDTLAAGCHRGADEAAARGTGEAGPAELPTAVGGSAR